MIRALAVLAMAVVLAVFTAIPAAAADGNLGKHIVGMTPDHAMAHGAMFGGCVSDMATIGSCPHQ